MKRTAILLAAALLLCSCGSVDDDTSPSPSGTTAPTAAATVTADASSSVTDTETTTTAPSTAAAAESTAEESEPEEKNTSADVELDTVLYDQLTGRNNSLVGCGPTSAAMLLTSEAGLDVSKDDAVELAYRKKYYYSAGYNFTSGFGVIQEDIQKLLAEYGCESSIDHLWTDTNEQAAEKIDKLLDEGHRLILGHRKPDDVLHYAVICGRHEENGETLYSINDPWGGIRWEWTAKELLDRLQNTAGSDATTVQGLVKGIQWITALPDSAE